MKFTRSQEILTRALKTSPLGSQTFSKSYLQYPQGASPLYLTHGKGAMVTDVDGNSFVDLVSGLMAITLGYGDDTVNQAIVKQLERGISFSLATELEYQLAEHLVACIPCAEKVHFVKNGSDATSAAIRIARAYTGKNQIAICGYHGWHDWYIGSTTRDKGIPDEVQQLVTRFPYNDLNVLEDLLKQRKFAAIIMEPVNMLKPDEGYLPGVRSLADKYGVLLVFDEMVTGFHFALGGAQQYFNVTPDLACFGKGMGNGMPVSAIVGKEQYMDQLQQVFVSGTFAGETLSLAAAIAVIDTMKQQPVIEHFWSVGKELADYVLQKLAEYGLENLITLHGYHPWIILNYHSYKNISADHLKSFFIKEMISNGVLMLSSHNITYSHRQQEIAVIKKAYDLTLSKLAENINSNNLSVILASTPIEVAFKVR